MTAPILALRAALQAALNAEGLALYDEVRDAVLPYASFGEWSVRLWSDDQTQMAEHRFAIHVWSRAPGDAEALGLAGQIATAIEKTLPPQPIVHWIVKSHEIRRPTREGVRNATLRVAALSEIQKGGV